MKKEFVCQFWFFSGIFYCVGNRLLEFYAIYFAGRAPSLIRIFREVGTKSLEYTSSYPWRRFYSARVVFWKKKTWKISNADTESEFEIGIKMTIQKWICKVRTEAKQIKTLSRALLHNHSLKVLFNYSNNTCQFWPKHIW